MSFSFFYSFLPDASNPVIDSFSGNTAEATILVNTLANYSSPAVNLIYNGSNLSNLVEVDTDTVSATFPRGGQAFGSSNNLIFEDSAGQSAPVSVPFNVGVSRSFQTLTVDFSGLNPDSPWNDPTYSDLDVGDQVSFQSVTNEGGYTVQIDGEGLVTLIGAGGETQIQSFNFYWLDASANYIPQAMNFTAFIDPTTGQVLIQKLTDDVSRKLSSTVSRAL